MHSRNFRLGLAVGSGKTFDEAAKELGQVAEGAYTVRAVVENSKKFDVEMPLAEGVYRILYGGESPELIMRELFARPLKSRTAFLNTTAEQWLSVASGCTAVVKERH